MKKGWIVEKRIVTVENLIKKAIQVMKKSYSPYSHFAVGAALLSKSGKVYVGTNVENASYGLSICAERSAVVSAVSAGDRAFDCIVVARNTNPPSSPCGACRQFLSEFGDFPVILVNPQGDRMDTTVDGLLPYSFRLNRSE